MTPPAAAPTADDRAAVAAAEPGLRRLWWLVLALFVAYLCIAMALPVISVFVTARLGYGTGLGGLAVGVAFASTILTRGPAGRIADGSGSRRCMVQGLWLYALAGVVCAAAAWPALPAAAAYAVLLAGRLLLGVGESLSVVGLMAWCFGVAGPRRSGLVFALVGMALYGAFAIGSPVGVALYNHAGFGGTMAACVLAPMLSMLMVLPVPAVAPQAGERPSFWSIIGRIREPGAVVALQGVGSAAIGAFVSLMFLRRGWPHEGLGLTCFGGAFVLVRVLFGYLPDRLGSIPVAMGSLGLEALGQLLLCTAVNPAMALLGAVLTGLGCSLLFPAMGIEVVRRVPVHLRGTAAGGLAAFQDLALGLTGPVTGLLAERFGVASAFLVGTAAAALGLGLVVAIARGDRRQAA